MPEQVCNNNNYQGRLVILATKTGSEYLPIVICRAKLPGQRKVSCLIKRQPATALVKFIKLS